MNCPVCGQDHVLMGGRFPVHTVLGDPCPGGGKNPDGTARIATLPLFFKAEQR